jgi:hypothetical protein
VLDGVIEKINMAFVYCFNEGATSYVEGPVS